MKVCCHCKYEVDYTQYAERKHEGKKHILCAKCSIILNEMITSFLYPDPNLLHKPERESA